MVPVTDIAADRARLLEIVRDKAVVHGRVTLATGNEADYYVDLRRITLTRGAPARRAGDARPSTPTSPGTSTPSVA